MFAEHLHRYIALIRVVRDTLDIRACPFSDALEVLIALVIDERTNRLDAVHELAEGLHIFRESGEYIDMIPCNAGEYSYMRLVPKELRPQVEWGSQVLIALENGILYKSGTAQRPKYHYKEMHIIAPNDQAEDLPFEKPNNGEAPF